MAPAGGRYLAVTGPRQLAEATDALGGPASGRVLVDIAFTGICGTDVHGYTDGHMLPPAEVVTVSSSKASTLG